MRVCGNVKHCLWGGKMSSSLVCGLLNNPGLPVSSQIGGRKMRDLLCYFCSSSWYWCIAVDWRYRVRWWTGLVFNNGVIRICGRGGGCLRLAIVTKCVPFTTRTMRGLMVFVAVCCLGLCQRFSRLRISLASTRLPVIQALNQSWRPLRSIGLGRWWTGRIPAKNREVPFDFTTGEVCGINEKLAQTKNRVKVLKAFLQLWRCWLFRCLYVPAYCVLIWGRSGRTTMIIVRGGVAVVTLTMRVLVVEFILTCHLINFYSCPGPEMRRLSRRRRCRRSACCLQPSVTKCSCLGRGMWSFLRPSRVKENQGTSIARLRNGSRLKLSTRWKSWRWRLSC